MSDPANDSVLSLSILKVIQLIIGFLVILFILKELGFLNIQMAPLGNVLLGSAILLALLYGVYEWVYLYKAEFTVGLVLMALVAAFLLSPSTRRDLKILSGSTYPSKKRTRSRATYGQKSTAP